MGIFYIKQHRDKACQVNNTYYIKTGKNDKKHYYDRRKDSLIIYVVKISKKLVREEKNICDNILCFA